MVRIDLENVLRVHVDHTKAAFRSRGMRIVVCIRLRMQAKHYYRPSSYYRSYSLLCFVRVASRRPFTTAGQVSVSLFVGDAADYCSRLESIPTVENVQESESFTLCCDVGHRPTDWTKDGETITFKPGSRYEREKNWRGFLTHLQVAKATYEDDNGTVYRCTGGDRETSIMVKVHPKGERSVL